MTNINIFLILLGLINGDATVTTATDQTATEVQVSTGTESTDIGIAVTECKAFPECPPDMDS
ncbi:hypothetical protein [Pleionea litopenaei]|uniref:Uncharacterized protein n=1 Tax=Pleionea litopenaei TaxID=3070815 RepID=A0AA51RSW8_9GAMM|nr:hypothetical protein [Pleionea sp. HL-JVS1]WMS86985.1 hypothetical protein Q9312_17360 [Pleionea sp. HL-JVS1]